MTDATDLRDRVTARLAALREERQRFLDQAQRQLAGFDAAIGELAALVEPPAAAAHEPRTEGEP